MMGGRATMASWVAAAFAVAWAALLPGRVEAADPRLERWNRELGEAVEQIRAGSPEKAIRKIDRLLAEFVDVAGPGEENAKDIGTMLVYRAVAKQAAGRPQDAEWDWDLASNFRSDIEALNLKPFGEAGQALLDYAAEWIHPAERGYELDARCAVEDCWPITPPKAIKKPNPMFTRGARHFKVKGDLVVQVVIDAEGRPRHPRVVTELPAPSLSFTALETLREWRFEPAMVGGRPVSVPFTLTIHYDPR